MAIPSDNIAFDFISPGAGATASGRIPIDVARQRHIDYLTSGKYVVHNNKIVHALIVNEDNYTYLTDNKDIVGLKLYFCREAGANGNLALSIIVVGFNANGENVIVGNEVVNNLDPCPDKCPGNDPAMGVNASNDLNIAVKRIGGIDVTVWCKPNEAGAAKWFKQDGTPVLLDDEVQIPA